MRTEPCAQRAGGIALSPSAPSGSERTVEPCTARAFCTLPKGGSTGDWMNRVPRLTDLFVGVNSDPFSRLACGRSGVALVQDAKRAAN